MEVSDVKVDASYVAAFIDAEGSFCASVKSNGIPYPCMSITNTNLEILQLIADWLGIANIYLADKAQSNDGYVRRHCYTLNIYGRNIADVLPKFMDRLIVKKEQAIAILELARLISSSNGKSITDDSIRRRNELAGYISWLNQGRP